MSIEFDENGGDVVMWTLKLMGLGGCRHVATDVDDIGVYVVM